MLLGAVRSGLEMLTWETDGFAYAESYDEAGGRYRGLRCGEQMLIAEGDPGLLVRPEVARRQLEAEEAARRKATPIDGPGVRPPQSPVGPGGGGDKPPTLPPQPKPRRYHGTVTLDPLRVERDAGRIAEEVITHLTSLVGASVRVTIEIEADVPGGVPESVERIVTENGRTLRFDSQGFEAE